MVEKKIVPNEIAEKNRCRKQVVTNTNSLWSRIEESPTGAASIVGGVRIGVKLACRALLNGKKL
jgi:hypothetical protein